jgi:surface protein
MFDNGEAKYNEGFEEGKNDVINGSQELTITKNGVYVTDYSSASAGGDGGQQITGEYPNGGQFYSYAKVKNAQYDTGIIADLNSRLEFWYKYTGEPNGDAWYEIIGAGNTDDNEVFQIRIYSAWYFHIGGSNKSVYGVTTNEWHHIIVSKADGIVIDGVKKSEFGGLGSYNINAPFYINGIGYTKDRMANGEFGMIKINDTIIIPTADGFKNLNTGEILPTVNNGYNGEYTYTGIEVGDIFEIGDLVKKITVDIATEDTNGSYEEGYNDGVAEQKTKLETITITENGTYTKEDGYNEVVVNVETASDRYEEGYNSGYSEGETNQKNKLTNITITENGLYTREDGYNQITVAVETGGGSGDGGAVTIKPNSLNFLFKNGSIDKGFSLIIDCTGFNDATSMFSSANFGDGIMPKLINTSGIFYMNSMFYNCKSLTSLPLLDTSNVTNMDYMFYTCSNLESIPLLDTSNVTSMTRMFNQCSSLTTIPLLDFSNVTKLDSIFYYCSSLTNVGGFINLSISLLLKESPLLTRESVLNIFNNLATVTVNTYIYLHSDVKARLTDDDIAIATSKGWIIS